MLRSLVLLFLLVNAALVWWLQSDAQPMQSDREPQRLGRQVSPDSIRVLPDLPASTGARGVQGGASAVSPVSLAASSPAVALVGTTVAPASASVFALARAVDPAWDHAAVQQLPTGRRIQRLRSG